MKNGITRLSLLLVVILGCVAIQNCWAVGQDREQLTMKETIWARMGEEDRMVAVPDGVFRRGETINLVVRNVGPFQIGPDQKHHFDIDMVVKGPSGEEVLNQKNLLGEGGHFYLEDDIAESPYGIFHSQVGMVPGRYKMYLTIRDVIGGNSLAISESFVLQEGLSHRKVIFARKNAEGTLVPVEDATFSRGEVVNMVFLDVGKFQKGMDGKHKFDIDLKVKNSNGELIFEKNAMLGENGHFVLENDIADSPYGMFYTTIDMEPGIYRITLEIYDLVSGQRVTVTKPFKLN